MVSSYFALLLLHKVAIITANGTLNFDSCKADNKKECRQVSTFLRDRCEHKGAKACGSLGYLYEAGLGVNKDIKKAMFYYQKACDLEYSLGCVNLGVIYTLQERFKVANNLFKKACDSNNAEGCVNLGVSYKYGYGFSIDMKKANSLFKNALEIYRDSCEGKNANDCINTASMYYSGIGVEASEEMGDKYLDMACEIDEKHCE